MRITILNQFYVPDLSPTAHLSASLAEHRASLGDEVTVVTSRGGYVDVSIDAKSERNANPSIRRVWTPRLGKSNTLKRCIDYGTFYLSAMMRMGTLPAQDVVISLTTPPYIVWAGVLHRALHRKRTKLILWNMDCYPEVAERSDKLREGGIAANIMRAMNRNMFRRLDSLVCLDRAMEELMLSHYSPKGWEVPSTIIPNWEKAAYFPKEAMQRSENEEPWEGVRQHDLDGRFVVLYLGNTGYGHRFESVLDAADILKDDPVTFLFVGGGSRWDWIEKEVKDRKLSNVCMHGYVAKDETRDVMRCADCALITLRDRILGVMSPSKLHSNLAMGLPIVYVGPEKSNVDDSIVRCDCGLSVRHGQPEQVAEYIRSLMNDSEVHSAACERARQAFEQAYCDEQTLPLFDEVIKGVVSGRAD